MISILHLVHTPSPALGRRSLVIFAEVKKSTWEKKVGVTVFEWCGHKQHPRPIQSSTAVCSPVKPAFPTTPFRCANVRVEFRPGRINGTARRRLAVMLRRVRQSLRQVLLLMARRPALLCGAIVLGALLILAVKFTCR